MEASLNAAFTRAMEIPGRRLGLSLGVQNGFSLESVPVLLNFPRPPLTAHILGGDGPFSFFQCNDICTCF